MQFPAFNLRGHVPSFEHNEYHMYNAKSFLSNICISIKTNIPSAKYRIYSEYSAASNSLLIQLQNWINEQFLLLRRITCMSLTMKLKEIKGSCHDTMASAPKCSPPTPASSDCYFLINVKPYEKRIICAWLSVIFLTKTDF